MDSSLPISKKKNRKDSTDFRSGPIENTEHRLAVQKHKKGQRRTLNPLVSLVAGEGFEPTTFGL
jgi:hypothetical protein